MSSTSRISPTTRTLRRLEELGYIADIVERRVARGVVHDLFGLFDVLAVPIVPGEAAEGPEQQGLKLLGVQATTASNLGHRVAKMLAEPRLFAWLAAGHEAHVWGWSFRGPRGMQKAWAYTARTLILNRGRVSVGEV